MPRPRNSTIPQMNRHHRGGAYVTLSGKQHWLGRHGSPEAEAKYKALVAEWLSHGEQLPELPAGPPTITELCVAYWKWVKPRQSSKLHAIKRALRLLRETYGPTLATEFGPVKLRTIRDELVRRGLSRKTITEYIGWIRSAFRFAVSHEMLLSSDVYERLRTLEPLRAQDVAKPARKVKPVPREALRRVRPFLTRPVRGLILLQLLTGSRADELVRLRAIDLNRSGDVWTYSPTQHKTAHHDKERVIYFGPRAQRVLRLFMRPGRPLDAPLFNPREGNAEAKRRNAKGARRPNQKPNPTTTERAIGDHYTTGSLRRAIERACDRAFPAPAGTHGEALKAWRQAHRWTPHRLRHTAATTIRREFGIEAARVILGHARIDVTELYAEVDQRKAIEVISKIG